MNEAMQQLVIIAALAIYNNKTKGGIVPALAYMSRNGIELNDAIDIIATYDRYEDGVKMGTFPE